MPEKFLQYIPFLMLNFDGKIKVNTTRIMEAVIYAVIGGLMSGYISIKIMQVEIQEIKRKVDKIYEDIYVPRIPRG